MTCDPALDGIRAIAIIMVMGFHIQVPGFDAGFLGVDAFFVLSGYLIAGLLVQQRKELETTRVAPFYKRRFWRLAPAFFVFLAVYAVIGASLWPGPDHVREVLLAAVYVSNYAIAESGVIGRLSHTWSLAVEAQFYFLWPLVFLCIANLAAGQRAALVFGLYVVATIVRIAAMTGGASRIQIYYSTHTHVSGLLLGCALAMLCETDWFRRRNWSWAGPVGIGAWILTLPWAKFEDEAALTMWVSVAELGTAFIIASIVFERDSRTRHILSIEPLPLIGLLSYSLYLWHYPFARLWREDMPWYWTAALVIPLSFACAGLSYMLIEKPVNTWRRDARSARVRRPSVQSGV